LNHCFFPDKGGHDFTTIRIDKIKRYLVINENRHNILLKPKVLYFEFMDDFNWSYFRLEVENLFPKYKQNVDGIKEKMFINEEDYDIDDYKYSLTQSSGYTEYSRYLSGSFIITKKTSEINRLEGELNAYNGLHCKMTHSQYKEFLQCVACKLRENTPHKK
jgi:hypothetical protein